MSDCPRFGRLFGGCKFSPRYDLGTANATDIRGPETSVLAIIEASKSKTYVHDVCERCGKTVERNS